mgnify:CR=1 FL=1
MKKILSVLAIMLAAFFIMACNSKPKAPEKTPAQLRADSVAKAKKDSINRISAFKGRAIKDIGRYLRSKVSSDPSFGKVLQIEDKILNDSIFFGKAKVLIKNQYGANEQYSDFWFMVCKKNNELYFLPWGNQERCERGLDHIVGEENHAIPLLAPFEGTYKKLMTICDNPNFRMEKMITDF